MSTGAGGAGGGVWSGDSSPAMIDIERDIAPLRAQLETALDHVDELHAATLQAEAEADRLRTELSERVTEAARRRREEGEREARLARAIAATEAARLEELAQATSRREREQRELEFVGVDADAPLMVPVLGFRQELVLRGFVLFGLATMAWFWMWWLGEGSGSWSAASVLVTLLFGWVSLLTLYFFFFATRMTRPNPALPVPRLRVAIVVTKAPSEPWSVIEKTLEAMLAQRFPYDYDVWLADERPSEFTLRWCLARRVSVSTRFGVTEYHQPNWPRRTKCKEGNLAWFYDCVGYDRYDVVAQLDADHVPAPDYLAAIVRPFRDERVGYVAAPSICDANADAGWTVRGRLYREATLHGPVQAGSNQGFAPVCIGSHYAVRTEALRSVGGLGPELAEDFTTTLWMLAGGWDGVFTIDAEAHGDGPESLAEMLTQEIQWSRSLGTVLTRFSRDKLRNIPLKARIRLGFALYFYPLQGVALAFAAILPTAGVVFNLSWGNTSLAAFYTHLWPMSFAGMATVAYLRRQQLLRPSNAKLWSWELLLFQLIRWPWALAGAFQGMWVGLQGIERPFKVTPKGERGLKPLPVQLIAPSLALGAIPAWVALATIKAGPTIGLLILATGQALTYLLAVTVAIWLHLSANARTVVPGGLHGVTGLWRGLAQEGGGEAVVFTTAVAIPTLLALLAKFLL